MTLGRFRGDERGISLTELMIASLVTAIIASIVIAWVGTVSRNDRLNQEDIAAVDELRVAKSRITKELRFAAALYPALSVAPDSVTVWIDADRSGTPADPGERITWAIEDDGTLTRTTDTGEVEIQASGLDPDASSIVLDTASSNIEIRLVSALDTGTDRVREIVTTVNVRRG
jgi:Tfp pilus assembly protein FimT